MKKYLLFINLILLLTIVTFGVASAQGTLVFADSFENFTVGTAPNGWNSNPNSAAIVVDSNEVIVADGSKAVKVVNDPSSNGELFADIDDIYNGKLAVQFYQPSNPNENINIEIHNGSHRIAGVFITASGNIRARDNGVQTGNLIKLANDRWHTLIIAWNVESQTFQISHLEGNNEVFIAEAQLDAPQAGKPGNRIYFNVSKRDEHKVAFFDDIKVYNLAK